MKILIYTDITGDAASNITSAAVPVNVTFFFEDGTQGGTSNVLIPWSTIDTATTLNAAIKSWAIGEMLAQQGYTYNVLTDQLFFMGGFVGI